MLEFERQLRISERFKPLEHHFIHVDRLFLRFGHKIVQHISVALFQSSISPIFKSPNISPKKHANKNQIRGNPNEKYPHWATNTKTNSTWHSSFRCCFFGSHLQELIKLIVVPSYFSTLTSMDQTGTKTACGFLWKNPWTTSITP